MPRENYYKKAQAKLADTKRNYYEHNKEYLAGVAEAQVYATLAVVDELRAQSEK